MSTAATERAHPTILSRIIINRDFSLLWLGQAISNLGDFVFDVTLVLWIATDLAAGQSWAPLAVSGVLVAAAVPMVVVGPVAGVFADRWDKRRTLLWMDAMRAVLVVALLIVTEIVPHVVGKELARSLDLAAIYAVVFLASVCSQFFNPSRAALISYVVPPTRRARASGLSQVTTHMAIIVGPPLAGPLFVSVGARSALGVNALSFMMSFAVIFLMNRRHEESVARVETPNAFREWREGLTFFRHNRLLVTILVSIVIVMCGAGALNALDVFFALQNLHANPAMYGFLSGAIGAGAVIGAILTTATIDRVGERRVFWVSLLLLGLFLTVYSRLTSFPVAIVIFFLTGAPMAALNASVMPLVLNATPRELVGRVMAVLTTLMSTVSLGSIAVSGWLVSSLLRGLHAHWLGMTFGPVDSLFTATGLLCVIAGVYALRSLRVARDEVLIAAPAPGQPSGEA